VVEVSGRTYPVEVRYRAVEEAEPDDFETDEERRSWTRSTSWRDRTFRAGTF